MVLGLRTKSRKGSTVQVDYAIHIQEIKPWPPSQSLRSLRSVLLQWENGERHSGSTSAVIPIIGSGVGDGNIEFNESFRLPVSLSRELTLKGGDAETFQKNCLELNLYETRRDKTVKGQLLGNAVIDLSEYGIIKEAVSISTPVNCKRSFRNTAQPVLFVKILPFDKENSSSSSKGSLAKEISLDKDSRESISALMNGEYAEEAEFASFTDDDVSSHSSLTISPSAFEANTDSQSQNGSVDGKLNEENASGAVNNRGRVNDQPVLPSEPVHAKSVPKPVAESNASNQALRHITLNSSRSSSMDLSYDPGSSENDDLSTSNLSERSLTAASKKYEPDQAHSSSSSSASEGTDGEVRSHNSATGFHQKDMVQEVHKVVDSRTSEIAECQIRGDSCTNGFGALLESSDSILRPTEKPSIVNIAPSDINEDWNGQLQKHRRNGSEEATHNSDIHCVVRGNKSEEEYCTNGRGENFENKDDSKEHGCLINLPPNNFSPASITKIGQTSVGQPPKISEDAIRNLSASDGNVLSLSKSDPVVKANSPVNGILKHKKMSVRSPLDSSQRFISGISSQFIEEVKEIDILEDACKEITDAENGIFSTDKVKYVTREMHDFVSDGKIRELELRVANLERELREVAALEAGLYSVVSEHGGSAHKVHAPARRLSRIYIHACKHWSLERRASAARSAVSGLVLVAKACGNDVPRLTFWLSNSIVLRAIISQPQYFGDSHLNLGGPQIESDCGEKGNEKKYTQLKWKDTVINEKEVEFGFGQALDDWQDRHTFTSALEKIESWIFSRIIESLWWQTLTPHMQSPIEKENGKKMGFHQRKSYGRISSLNNQEQGNFSITLWKRAFKDACERLCPVRAGGHECGCLPMLARLVMEQCVARLDVAMFNAILRESDDDIPTDPISDPISDSKVLPVPSGKTSFSAGAQLKNAIGNWSRWLTDLFGIDADDSPEIDNELDDERLDCAESFKSFHLLNALSDLLMLPKDMLLDESIRKEVCPTFGAPLIKRILCDFVPDEFCPDPIPEIVLEALDSENSLDCNEESIEHFPWKAVSIVYSPPSVASVSAIIGNLRSSAQLGRSGSSVLRKCHTSDDELDELDSPFMSIAVDKIPAVSGQKLKEFADGNGGSALRYQLLREVWMDGDR